MKVSFNLQEIHSKILGVKLDPKQMTLISLVCFIVIYLDFSLFLKMQRQGVMDKVTKSIALKKEMENLQNDLRLLKQFKEKQKDTASFKRILKEEEVPLLMEEISTTANTNNVKIMQMRPSKVVKEKAISNLFPVLLDLEVSCGYHQLGKFINNLENGRVFIALQDMRISREPGDFLSLRVNLIVKTYVRK